MNRAALDTFLRGERTCISTCRRQKRSNVVQLVQSPSSSRHQVLKCELPRYYLIRQLAGRRNITDTISMLLYQSAEGGLGVFVGDLCMGNWVVAAGSPTAQEGPSRRTQ